MPLPTWYPQRNEADEPDAVLKNFVHHAKVPLTGTTIEQAVQGHPAYPHFSLGTFAHLLQSWRIATKAVQIQVRDLPRVRYPAIAYLPSGGGTFVLLCHLADEQIFYIHPRLGWVLETVAEFSAKWQGKLLLAIPTEGCGEHDYAEKRAEELSRQSSNPSRRKVRTFPRFLSPEECAHLIAVATPLFAPSEVVSSNSPERHHGRSSYSAMLAESEDPLLQEIYVRTSRLLSLPLNHLEYGQCVSYTKGQEYRAHFDTLDESTPFGQEMIARYGQRRVTVLFYLNEDFEGGDTYFPTLDYKIQPQQGTAVVFYSLDALGRLDPDALHAGLPVFSGRKYAFNLWGWDRPFRRQNP